MYKFSQRSLRNLKGVHPDLVDVITLALAYTPYDFVVDCGVRSYIEQEARVVDGSSKTFRSAHIIQSSGFGHAVDLYVLVNGKVTWEHKYFRKVVQAIFRAAIELGVQVEAGALWRDLIDSPHIQLAQHTYGGEYI